MSSCEVCGGTGFEIVVKDGRDFARPCACRKGAAVATTPEGVLAACRIPPRYRHCTFDNFTPGGPPLRAALEKALSYCAGYPYTDEADHGLGLLFTGDNGVGKTHLAVAVLQELALRKGVRGQFWDFHELIREIKNSYNNETKTTELQVLEPVIETELLVLDDLGAWRMTDWMNDTLFYILNSRYMAQRASIITTNFQDVDAKVAASRDNDFRRKEYLIDRIGLRLRSRLMEMCVVIPIQGADHRQEAQHGKSAMLGGSDRSRRPR
jgi:DNA replication protein DnaC